MNCRTGSPESEPYRKHMGGMGSGRWGQRSIDRTLTDSCLFISITDLRRGGGLEPGSRKTCTAEFDHYGRVLFVRLDLDLTPRTHGVCAVTHTDPRTGAHTTYRVRIMRTGGLRYWFSCPLQRDGGMCGRRVAKLYLPPGGTYFGCRDCYRLAYRSHAYRRKTPPLRG